MKTGVVGLEPTPADLEDRYSIQLSYTPRLSPIYPWLDSNQQLLPSKGSASCQLGYRGKLKSEWQGSNLRHPASKAGALPTALHPGILLVGVEPTHELFLRELPLPIGLQECTILPCQGSNLEC